MDIKQKEKDMVILAKYALNQIEMEKEQNMIIFMEN